jgi:hypothetical protein
MNTPNEIEAIVNKIMGVCAEIDWRQNLAKPTVSEVLSNGKSTTDIQKRLAITEILTQLNANRTAELREAVNARTQEVVEMLKAYSPTDYRGYGLSAGGGLVRGMTLDDHKRNFVKDILKLLSPEVKDTNSLDSIHSDLDVNQEVKGDSK